VARREYNRDPDFRNRTRVSDEEFDRLVRNVYKVLLTRGMVGTVIYSPDAETRRALRDLIPEGRLADVQWGSKTKLEYDAAEARTATPMVSRSD
jgi:hypothetical protein